VRGKFALAALFVILLAAGPQGQAAAQEVRPQLDVPGSTASLPATPDQDIVSPNRLPQPLDLVNADRYRDIFRLQQSGDFAAADRVISQLTDLSLLGTVLAERYLSPRYPVLKKELADWLADYAMLPDAPEIYDLAIDMGAGRDVALPKLLLPTISEGDETQTDRNNVWDKGLTAWRKGDFKAAANAFVRLVDSSSASPSNKARYAYWAARAYLRDREPEKVSVLLKIAAKQPLTFYGQLARRALGVEDEIDWTTPRFNGEHAEQLLRSSAGKRGLMLIQIGELNAAEKELVNLERESIGKMEKALLALSQAVRLPGLAAKLCAFEPAEEGEVGTATLYPVPDYKPNKGFTVDRALVYAIIRLESGFNPSARNKSGALGLMQMMPGTARVLGYNPKQLTDPAIAIEAGEKYVKELLAEDVVGGDLLLMLAAYNAGPGNLSKWKDKARAGDDALLFLEAMPARETRQFVRRAMASYWIYQQRFGQETPSLTALASGGWPRYVAQDAIATASNAN
jgi:soluble lytic murein transglycosylase-like protein